MKCRCSFCDDCEECLAQAKHKARSAFGLGPSDEALDSSPSKTATISRHGNEAARTQKRRRISAAFSCRLAS